jgi:hypothetical protein
MASPGTNALFQSFAADARKLHPTSNTVFELHKLVALQMVHCVSLACVRQTGNICGLIWRASGLFLFSTWAGFAAMLWCALQQLLFYNTNFWFDSLCSNGKVAFTILIKAYLWLQHISIIHKNEKNPSWIVFKIKTLILKLMLCEFWLPVVEKKNIFELLFGCLLFSWRHDLIYIATFQGQFCTRTRKFESLST